MKNPMNPRDIATSSLSLGLLPLGLGVASQALRGSVPYALGIYVLGLVLYAASAPAYSPWANPDSIARMVRYACLRIFLLITLTAMHTLGNCPTWYLGLMIATALMQSGGFFLLRPSRLSTPFWPEVSAWNTLAQCTLTGIFLSTEVSEPLLELGFLILGFLQIIQLGHDFYRMRRPVLYWLRSLAFQTN